jgi:L-iditol 2-dehydrogenase
MKVQMYYGPGDVRLEDVESPKAGKGEVVIKVKAALTCGTDLKTYLRGHHLIKPPSPFGHEMAGIIEEVGEGVSGFEKGMRVVPNNSAPCGHCYYCRRGLEELCEDLLFNFGAYAEYARIPERIVEKNLMILPENVSFEHGALVEPLSCVAHGIDQAGIKIGDTVAINGCGPIGAMFVRLSKLKGARVIVTDLSSKRLKATKELGADETILLEKDTNQIDEVKERTEDKRGVDVAIEAVGLPEVWEKTIQMVRPGGAALLFGGPIRGTTITVGTALIHYSEVTLKGVFHHTPYYGRVALDLVESGKIMPEKFISERMPLNKLIEALELVKNKEGMKYAIIPELG